MDPSKITYCIEGQDGAGKSSLIKELQKKLPDLKYYHFEFPQGTTNEEKFGFQWGQFDMMFKFIKMGQGQVQYVFDRAHIGEYIWSPKYRNRFPEYMTTMEDTYKDLNIVLVLVECDSKEIHQRLQDRINERVPYVQDIEKLGQSFRIFCERSPFPVFKLDTTGKADPAILIGELMGKVINYEQENK